MILTPTVLAQLDMPNWVGQRSVGFRFVLINAVQAASPIDLHPLRDTTPTLTHDTSRTIKRQVQGFTLGVDETPLINVLQSRVLLYMIVGDETFPLGRYMFADRSKLVYTNGRLTNATLFDEMFIVDQQIEESFSPTTDPSGVAQGGLGGAYCDRAVRALLRDLPVTVEIEPTPFTTIGSWAAGTTRGQITEQLSLDGDWFSPWFGNDTKMHFIRAFDPATRLPTFNLDIGNRVIANSIIESDDLITAPNRFIIVSNGVSTDVAAATSIVGRADVPTTAPHSITNRGFVIPSVQDRPVDTIMQATAIAQNIATRQTVFERTELATVPDPRHDSYDVILWQGERWLELAWMLPLIEGAAMGHVMRKVYS